MKSGRQLLIEHRDKMILKAQSEFNRMMIIVDAQERGAKIYCKRPNSYGHEIEEVLIDKVDEYNLGRIGHPYFIRIEGEER